MAASHQRGYNHNIAHRGRVYHVQSEDSGSAKSHIYTHVFVNGTIIATNKVDYDANIESPQLATHVVALMQASHKKMIKQLRNGELDQKIEVLLGGHPEAAASKVRTPTQPPAPSVSQPPPVLVQQKISRTPPARRVPPAPPPPFEPNPATHLNPSLRSPLSANEHAQSWLTSHRKENSPTPATPNEHDRQDAKTRLDELRRILAQQVPEPCSQQPVEEELAQLFADL